MKINPLATVRVFALGAALAMTMVTMVGQAHAIPVNGSDSIITFTVAPIGGVGDLLSATGFAFGTQVWGSGARDFTAVPVGTLMTSSVITMGSLGSYTFSSADGSFAAAPSITIGGATYTSAVVGTSGSVGAGSESLSLYLVGTFTPAGTLSTLAANNASETISFTETGIGFDSLGTLGYGSFSVSATFASPAAASSAVPPPTNTPEPASMMLLGAGLLGLGAIRRRV